MSAPSSPYSDREKLHRYLAELTAAVNQCWTPAQLPAAARSMVTAHRGPYGVWDSGR